MTPLLCAAKNIKETQDIFKSLKAAEMTEVYHNICSPEVQLCFTWLVSALCHIPMQVHLFPTAWILDARGV